MASVLRNGAIPFSLASSSSSPALDESACQSGTIKPPTPAPSARKVNGAIPFSLVSSSSSDDCACQPGTITPPTPVPSAPSAPLKLGGHAVTKAEPQSSAQLGTTTASPAPAPAPAPDSAATLQSPALSGTITAPTPTHPWWAPVPKYCLSGGEANWAYMGWCWEWQFVLYQRGVGGMVWETHEEYMGGEFIMDPRDG